MLLKIVERGAESSALNTSSFARSGNTKGLKRQQLAAQRWIRRHTRLVKTHHPELAKIAQAHAEKTIRTATDVAAPPIEFEAPPRELAVHVHPMQVASLREADEIGIRGSQTPRQANTEVGSRLAESFASLRNLADTTAVSEFASVAVAQQVRVGKPTRAPWMLQALATLGGAAAAGSVAWFLIGPMRERRWG